MEEKKYTSMIRLRMSAKDAHYGGNLVDGAHMVHLFGDVATELLITTTSSSRRLSTPATTSRPTVRSPTSATPPAR